MPEQEIIERPRLPQQSWGVTLAELVRDPNVSAEKLDIAVRVNEQRVKDEASETYQFHFAQFAKEMPPVEKDGMVDLGAKGRYPFTTYEEMDGVLRPRLADHGFALQFWSKAAADINVVMVYGALMGWGHERVSEYPVPPDTGPGRNALQARGSSQTYAKRYIADLLCNIVRKGVDNDGRMTADNYVDAKQLATLIDLLKKTDTDEQKFLGTMVTGVPVLADVRARDYPRLELALREKLKRAVRKEEPKNEKPKQ